MTMTTERPAPDPVEAAISDVEGFTAPDPSMESDQPAKLHDILLINYSGELEKVWATMILASTAGAMQVPCRVFVTFWGLQNFVKDEKRVTGKNWMQKMMSVMSATRASAIGKLSKMNFMGMGPWMMGAARRSSTTCSPKELLEIAQEMGVEFIPCQMTMDMFGLKPR